MNNSYFLKGGRIINPASGRDETGDLLIINGIIAEPTDTDIRNIPEIDVSGMVIAPGFIDMHVHFRDPGQEGAETNASGSAAAAKGGFVKVVTMPNTTPAIDSPELIKKTIEDGKKHGLVDILPSGCVSLNRSGKTIAPLEEMMNSGAVAFTDDGTTIDNEDILTEALIKSKQHNFLIMDHALDRKIAGNGVIHEGEVSQKLNLPGIPNDAEISAVKRNIRLAGKTDGKIHIQHISAGETVQLIADAKKSGIAISAEATPHHIALADTDIDPNNSNYKMNPPLGSQKDRQMIIDGLCNGTIEALATDHAPHLARYKNLGFLKAPFGIIGLETAVGVTYSTLVKQGFMTVIEWLKLWTTGPAKLLNLPPPSLIPGQPADIVVLNLNKEWTVNPETFVSKSKNTPFTGCKLTGIPEYTFLNGKITWKVIIQKNPRENPAVAALPLP